MNRYFLLLISIFIYFISNGQETDSTNTQLKIRGTNNPQQTTKGTFYATFGYNFDWFQNSDIHFEDHTTNNYDFTLYDVAALDKKGEINNVFESDLTIPQYSYRFGYWFNDKHDLGIELNYKV